MEITKSTFWGQNSGGTQGGQANFLGSGGIIPGSGGILSSLPTTGDPENWETPQTTTNVVRNKIHLSLFHLLFHISKVQPILKVT